MAPMDLSRGRSRRPLMDMTPGSHFSDGRHTLAQHLPNL